MRDHLSRKRSLYKLFVRLKILIRESLFYGKKENLDRNTPLNNLSKGTWHHIRIWERKGPSRGVIQKVRSQV